MAAAASTSSCACGWRPACAQDDPAAARSTAALRAELATHGSIEVAGYELAAPLVKAIDACDASALALPPCTVHWFVNAATPTGARVAANAARLSERWAPRGVKLLLHPVDGVPFWGSGEVLECPALLAATTSIFSVPAP